MDKRSGTNLEVWDDAVELWEAGEAEEDVDDVGREIRVPLPVFAKHTGQRANHRFWTKQKKAEHVTKM